MFSRGLRTQVVGHLRGAVAHVRHVAVGARHAAARVDPLTPQLELGMLGLENGSSRLGVAIVEEALSGGGLELVPVGFDLLRPQAPAPGEGELRPGAAVVLDVGHWAQAKERISVRLARALGS